jgi:hypothetical protein
MTWATPKITWGSDDILVQTDMNRIETNINGSRFGHNDLGSNLASADNLVITKDYHKITGSVHILYMSIAAYQPGAIVRLLIEDSGLRFFHNESTPPGDSVALYLTLSNGTHGSTNGGLSNYLVEFLYSDGVWRNISTLFI